MAEPAENGGHVDHGIGRAPSACSVTSPLRSAAGVSTSAAVRPVRVISTAARPVSSARRKRSADVAGAEPDIGRASPMASTIAAMVEAVPITVQVPTELASLPLISVTSASSIWSARYCAQMRRQSVQAPSRSPRWLPVSMGPVGRTMAGTSLLAAAMTWAGMVLSQPPIRITASMGWARTISSVSMAIRLRRNMEVGEAKLSWMDMVGKTMGRPPASITPRLAASMSWGTLPWQGL